MRKLNLLIALFLAFTLNGLSQGFLTTVPPLNGGNGSAGVTFGLTTNQTILIDTIYCTFNSTGQTDVWYTTTDLTGPPNITTTNGWTQVGTANITTGANGAGSITAIPLNIGITATPGTGYRFYVNGSLGAALAYTSGTAGAAAPFTDGIITIETGNLVGYGGGIPNPNFHPRQFNGAVAYTILGGLNDAAVLSIDSPTVFCAGNQNVVATIGNFGSNQIDSVDVNWEFNGVAQPTIQYVGLLDTNNGVNPNTAQVLLGNMSFPAGSSNIVKVWTSNPNGMQDTSNFNDTTQAVRGPALQGNFTVDPNLAASATNFTSIGAMEAALNGFGICGPVNITIASGVYNESLFLDNISGLSTINTLNIDGGDSSQTFLSHDGSTNLSTVTLSGVSNVTIQNLGIRATGANSGVGVLITGAADNNQILNNDVRVNTSSTSSAVSNIVFSGSAASATTTSSAPFNNNMIANNYMIGGYYGFRMYSAPNNAAAGNVFMNNQMDSIYYYGVYAGYLTDVEIIGNDIDQSKRGQTNGDGIYLLYTNNGRVNENSIIAEDWGFYWSNSVAATSPLTRYNEVINNMIISNGDYANYLYSIDSVNYWHNSLQTFGSGSPALYIGMSTAYPMGEWDCRNNIMASNDGPAMDIFTATDTIFSKLDNNDYYTAGGTVLINIDGTTFPDLPSYQSAQPLLNTASLEGDPQYTSPIDLHIVGAFVNDSGDASVPVAIDIDGDTRPMPNAASVDMGADEYDPPACPPPGNQNVANISSDTATLVWLTNTPGNTVQYEWMPCGTPQGSGTFGSVAADSVNISGLNPASCYEYWVREICGRGDTSIWIGPFAFNTNIQSPQGVNCTTGNPSVVFVEEFDAVGGWTGDVGTGITVAQWNFGHSGGTGSANTGPSNGAHSGANYVYMEGSGGTPPAIMVSPAIDLSGASGEAELSFWLHATGTEIGDLDLRIGTSPTGPFTPAFSWSGQLQTAMAQPFQNVGVDLTSYIGQTIYLQFEYTNWVCCGSDVAIDLLEVSTCVSCPAPDSLAAYNISLTDATLNWRDNAGATSWELSYGPRGGGPGAGVSSIVTSRPVNLTGLTPSTSYEFYVRAICAPGDTSSWSQVEEFGTANGVPYFQDFEAWQTNATGLINEAGWMTLGTPTPHWEVSTLTTSGATGPAVDHTTGTSSGQFVHLETSGGGTGDTDTLWSAPIYFAPNQNAVTLEYWYHMHGAAMGTLEVYVDTNGVLSATPISTFTGQQHTNQNDPWLSTTAVLGGYADKSIQLVFVGIRGTSFTSDMAIDDVRLFIPSPTDGGVTDISGVATSCGLSTDSITVEITNFGTGPLSNFPVEYTVNGGTPVTETFTGTIASGTTANYTFTTPITYGALGNYNIVARTNITNDGDATNDDVSIAVDKLPFPTINPATTFLVETFENGNGGWTANTGGSWGLGTPSGTVIGSANSGVNAWVTNLAGNYPNNANDELTSPCFDLSTAVNPAVQFSLNYDTETGWDGGILQVTTDGTNWTTVGGLTTTPNWYTGNANAIGGSAWVGNSGGWITAAHDLFSLAGESSVRLRFVFQSDGSVNGFDGIGIDDIVVYDNINVGINEQDTDISEFSLSPNPSNGLFKLQLNTEQAEQVQLSIRDIDGKMVYEEWLNVNGNFSKAMDLSDLAKGVYFLQLQNGNTIKVEKLILQ